VGSSSPKDLAHRAASCALAWRTLLAGRTVVVATGRAAMLAQRAPVGAAIDAAAALARESPSDGVILDETTASLLADAFQVQRERDRHVLIGRLNSEPMRELLGRPIPCVGRERELAMLVSLLDESIGESVARAVLVVAPAGTGKTRLVDEFVRGARERLGDRPIAKIRLDAHDATSPFGLAARCVRQIAQLDSRLAPVERWHALAQRIGARLPGAAGQRAASFLAEIIVADGAMPADPQVLAARRDPVAMAAGVRAAFLDWMAAEVGTEPNVLVIEDLHWADAPSVRLVEALLERLSDSPLTVIATARPEVDAAFPTLFAGRDLQALRLGALARRAAARLVRAALPEANDALVESIVQRAAGHPFYVEELIRAIASGASPDVLPDSVLGMLQGRLDALDENARRVLRAASVFGQVFHDEAVGSLLADRGAAIAGLDVLVDREVIERMAGAENSRFGTYMFRHALVRDAAYATLPDGERVRAHALAAAWLEREAEADPAVLADHYERGDVAERAAHWFTVAAGKALDANDLAGCIAAADRARFHTPVNETGFLDLLVGEATYWRGDPAGSATFAQRALERLEPGSESWFRAATLLVAGAGQGGDNDTVDRVVTRAGATPPAKGAEGELAGLLARGVTQLVWLGPTVSGPHRARLAEVAPDARAFDPRLAALIHRAQGDYATVIEFDLLRGAASLDQAVEAFERAGGARDAQMVSLLALAWRGMAGDGEAAVRLEQRIAELERVSMPYARNFARMLLGQLLLSREEAERAIAILRDAVPALRGSVRLVFHARQGLALAYFERGRYEDALRENAAVLEMPARGKLLATATAVQALACLAVGRRDEAVAAARAGLEQAKPSDRWEVLEGLVELAAASVFVATGARDEAARVVEEGMTRLSRMASHMPDGGSAFWAIPIPNRRLRELAREIGLEGR
jgi:tetratricopeptide (TPR) repeat protein